MVKVSVNSKGLFIDGEKIPLISGEFHYWRVNKSNWSQCLHRIIEAGFKVVATYVPWNYHEIKPKEYDFKGRSDPQRDLDGFLSLCEQNHLYVIVRPGPYIYSEWPHYGPPERVIKYHRLSEKFLEETEDYIQAVSSVLKSHLATQGGGILLLQADNEIDPFVPLYRNQLGLDGGEGPFQRYLKGIYENIQNLNEAWQTYYDDFTKIRVFETPSQGEFSRMYFDYRSFLEWYVCEFAKKIVSMYKKNGIDVPIYLNTFPTYGSQNLYELQKIADIVGIDTYPPNMLKNAFDKYVEFLKYAKATTRFPYIAEFECGIWYGGHYGTGALGASHYRLKDLLALACGIKGWNYYMLVDRDNWMMSPINEWGRVHTDLFSWMKEMTRIFNDLKPESMRKLCDLSVLAYRPHKWVDAGNWDMIQESLHETNIDYELYDPWTKENCKTPFLIYAGANFMLKRDQEKLRSYVEKGGTLIFFMSPPTKDMDGKATETLAEVAPPPVSSKDNWWPPEISHEIILKGVQKTARLRRFWTFDVSEKDMLIVKMKHITPVREEEESLVNVSAGATYVAGYMKKVGRGRVLMLGFDPSLESIELATEVLKIPYYSKASIPNTLTFTYQKNEGEHIVFILNKSEEIRETTIAFQVEKLGLKPSAKYHIVDMTERKEEKITGKNLLKVSVKLQPHDVKILLVSEEK